MRKCKVFWFFSDNTLNVFSGPAGGPGEKGPNGQPGKEGGVGPAGPAGKPGTVPPRRLGESSHLVSFPVWPIIAALAKMTGAALH